MAQPFSGDETGAGQTRKVSGCMADGGLSMVGRNSTEETTKNGGSHSVGIVPL